MALTEEDVLSALRDCYDPELPVNIVDLGLIYKVTLTPDERAKRAFPRQRVEVEMSMTSQGCPSHVMIIEQVRKTGFDVDEVRVRANGVRGGARHVIWIATRAEAAQRPMP